MSSLDERSHTFVVRIWEERRDVADAPSTWRGRVDDSGFGVDDDLADRGRQGLVHVLGFLLQGHLTSAPTPVPRRSLAIRSTAKLSAITTSSSTNAAA